MTPWTRDSAYSQVSGSYRVAKYGIAGGWCYIAWHAREMLGTAADEAKQMAERHVSTGETK